MGIGSYLSRFLRTSLFAKFVEIELMVGLVGGFAILGAMCAVLSVVGEALLRHKTKSPYVHLAVGCALFMLLGALPFVGGFVVAATALVGVGVLIATRAAGLVKPKNGSRPADGAYATTG